MASKPPGPFPPPGTLKAKLVNLIPRANVIVYRWSNGRFGGTRRRVAARRATAEEKTMYWPRLTAGYPFYDDYQARTTRDIAVIVLTPTGPET
jgi:hypothetical protein